MKIINSLLLTIVLFTTSMTSHAGKIYRFLDKEGVSTMSKSLPPYAAQQGYDILDDKSLRLIERVQSQQEQKAQRQRQVLADAEKERKERLQEEEAQRIKEQKMQDQNLIDRYPSEAVLIEYQQADNKYHQGHLKDQRDRLDSLKKTLRDLQTQAGELELNGQQISEGLTKKLATTQINIQKTTEAISQKQQEIDAMNKEYEKNLLRLRQLLTVDDAETLN